jgi:hypothetical protein
MQVLLFLSRPLVIMTWCKMWDLGFGAADAANPYGQMEDATPAPPPRGAPRGRRRLRGRRRRVQAPRRARREPLARAGRRRLRASRRGAAVNAPDVGRFVRAFRRGSTRIRSIRDARSDETHDTRGGTRLLARVP